jgi:XTP/dITP diphosphohydrolase
VRPVNEDADTLAANARRKATGYAKQLARWILSDDTGLEVDALGGAPGVRSARYAGENATMAENRARLLTELSHVPDEQRTARFVCRIAIADPTGAIVLEAERDCRGSIRRDPAGTGGFGYDALFEVAGTGRTLAELTTRETSRVGHRGRAVRALLDALQTENP